MNLSSESLALADGSIGAARVLLPGNDDLADELHRRKRVISETAAPQAARGIQPETLFRLCFTEVRRPGEGEENDLLAGYRADVRGAWSRP